jgi:hypothetical protein
VRSSAKSGYRTCCVSTHLSANEIRDRISWAMTDWIRDAEQYDDLTFIVMKIT